MKVTDAKEIGTLYWPEFVEYAGGLFLARALPTPRPSIPTYSDLTKAETLHNHVHILDEYDHEAALDGTDPSRGYWNKTHPDFLAACAVGKQVAAMWQAKLRLEYPGRRTRVYFTSDNNPVVRFHCVRPDEPVWLDEERWAWEIKLGRIVVLDSGAPYRGAQHN